MREGKSVRYLLFLRSAARVVFSKMRWIGRQRCILEDMAPPHHPWWATRSTNIIWGENMKRRMRKTKKILKKGRREER
jgi:hypothetical protein